MRLVVGTTAKWVVAVRQCPAGDAMSQDESLLWAGEASVALSGHLKVPLYAATLMGHAAPPSPAPTGLFFIKLCPCVNSREADQNNNFM